MTQNYTLKDIFSIPERHLTEEMLNFDWLNHEQKLEKWRKNVEYSVIDRMEYIEKVQRNNKEKRLLLLQRAKDDPKIQKELWEKCGKHPIIFFNMFLRTYNPRLNMPHLPFITYPYQDVFINQVAEAIDKWIDVWVDKSRDMWFSWLVLWILTRWFLFKWWSSLIWSYKEWYVDEQWNMDSSFERLRYIFSRLPWWMKPNDMIEKFMSVSKKEWWECEIAWDCGPNFWTWWRRKVSFLDEFALWVRDDTALRKTKDISNCRIFWWTPEWTNNVYGKVMTDHPDYKHLLKRKIRLYRKDHPLKTDARYKYQQHTRTTLDLAKEVDISYETSVTWAVYPLFKRMATKWTFVYNIKRKTYWSWDFWRDSNSFILWQKDFITWAVYVIKTFERVWRHIKDFAWLVIWKPYQWNNWAYSEDDYQIMDYMRLIRFSNHFWDPYNSDTRTTAQTDTIRTALREMWVNLTTNRKSTLKERITKTQLWLNRLFYDSDCVSWEQAIIQSHYPQIKEWSESTAERDKPVHDENSHYRTATEYFFDNEPSHDIQEDDWGFVYTSWLTN